MTAGVITHSTEGSPGLRPINPRRDIARVAELIEEAFAGNLDATGRRMVREMRALGRFGWLGWLLGLLLLPPAARPQGYVWEEDGRVVGNASLLPVRGYPERWVMANVAVHPDYRRRGIGRQLVQACEDLATAGGAESVVLQVEHHNQAAQALYAGLRFERLRTRSKWRHPGEFPITGRPISEHIRQSSNNDWPLHKALAERAAPEGVIWPFPLEDHFFQPQRGVRHWLYWHGQQLIGGLSVRQGAGPAWGASHTSSRLVLVVDRQYEGQIEVELIHHGLSQEPIRGSVLLMDYPVGVASESLRSLGFRELRALTWMKKELQEGTR